jgi:hypothetical protein
VPQQPNRLFPDTPLQDNLALINDNADKAVQDISDLGAKFSSLGSFSVTIPAGQTLYPYTLATINVSNTSYVPGRLQIVPRFAIYVDNDMNSAYLLGYANSQSNKAVIGTYIQQSPSIGSVADNAISIQNMDSVSHVYYVYWDESYVDSPRTGTYR